MALYATITQARAIDTYLTISVSGSNDRTLSVDEAGARELKLSGSITGNLNVILPVGATDIGQSWLINNATSGAYTVTVKAATGAGVIVTQGKKVRLYWDGTDMLVAFSDLPSAGAAASGSNGDITALTGITSGITAAGGLNLAGALAGNSATPAPLTLGRLSKSVAGSINVTLSASEYANPWIEVTGAVGADISVFVPLTAGAVWNFRDATTGGHVVTVIGATGTGVALTNTKRQWIGADGTNVVPLATAV